MAYTQVKTPIVYYGGKTAILNHLLELVPPHEVYTEVFFGGGALFWAKQPAKNETINDLNDNVIIFYRVLKTQFRSLKRLIDQTVYSKTLHRLAWQMLGNSCYSDVERAWAFWMRANFSFASKLDGGLKYSNHQSTMLPAIMCNKKSEFTRLLQERIENAYIECDDYMTILKSRNVAKAFHELDPPYFHGPDNRPADQGHYKNMLTLKDYEKLLQWLARECKGKFMLHNYNSEMLDRFVRVHGWHKREITHRLQAPRKSGPTKLEVIVTNYSTPCGTLKLF